MNKLGIILNIIGCGGCILTGSSAIYNATIQPSNVAIIDSGGDHSETENTATPTEPAIREQPKDETDEKVEEVITAQTSNSQPDVAPASISPTGHTATAAYSTPEPAKPTYTPDVNQYNSLADWESDMMGLCPSQRPKSNVWGGSYLPAIGISGLGQATSPDRAAELAWDSTMKTGQWASAGFYSDYAGKSCTNDKYIFMVDWSNKTIYWKMSFGGEKEASPELWQSLDNMAAQMTARLQWVDNAYHSKCPNN